MGPMIKCTILLRKKPEMTQEEFVRYHRETHAALFRSLPESREYVRRYVQQHPIEGGILGMPERVYDGITELWFDDVEALRKLFGSKSYMDAIRPDEENFLDLGGCSFMVSTENVVM